MEKLGKISVAKIIIRSKIGDGIHINKDTKVMINNVLVSFLSLLTAPWIFTEMDA